MGARFHGQYVDEDRWRCVNQNKMVVMREKRFWEEMEPLNLG
jgi:hypothetical protein